MSVDKAVALDGDTHRFLGLDNLQDLAVFLNLLPARDGRVHVDSDTHRNYMIFVGV